MDTADLIDRLGGNRGVAALTGATAKTISGWRTRGIPARFWLTIRTAAAAQGLDWSPPQSPAPDAKMPRDRAAAA